MTLDVGFANAVHARGEQALAAYDLLPREARRLAAGAAQEIEGVDLGLAARDTHRVQRRADEQVVLHAGNLRRRLERNEEAHAGTRLHAHREQILPIETRLPANHAIARVASEREAERALAAAVGAHQHHQRAGRHVERDRLEHVAFAHVDTQVAHVQQRFGGCHGRAPE